MGRTARSVFIAAGVVAAALAVGYFVQASWALATWPWAEGRLSNIFMSSMLAAASATLLFIGVTAQRAAAAPGLLHLAIILSGMAGIVGPVSAASSDGRALRFAIAAAVGAIACLVAFPWAQRAPVRDVRPLPRALRAWFVVYIAILLPAGLALLLQVPGVMPWPLKPATSGIYGTIFLAAIASFAYPLVRPSFEYANVGLIGFLAYDVVLLPPMLAHFETVRPELTRSLVLYCLVLAQSGAISVYYLLWHPRRSRAPGAAQPA